MKTEKGIIRTEVLKQTDIQNITAHPRPTDNPEKQKQPAEEKPTAIVRPKYQKSSFDERQLPVIACVNRDKPWFDISDSKVKNGKKANTSSSQLEQRKPKHKNSSRNATKSAHLKPVVDSSKTVERRDRTGDGSECKLVENKEAKKKSVIAIVQPIKMEKCDDIKTTIKSKHEKDDCNKLCMENQKSDTVAADKKNDVRLEQKHLSGIIYYY